MALPYSPSMTTKSDHIRSRRRIAFIASLLLGITTVITAGHPVEVDAACGSFQSRVNNARAGSTIKIPKCTFKEAVTVNKKLTINAYGATIDGENVRSHGISILHDDVTINGLTVTRVNSSEYVGAVWTSGADRFTFRNGVAKNSATICVSLNGGTGHRILNSSLKGCGKEGYFANGVSHTLFKGNAIHHNNTALRFNPGWEAGGGKTISSDRVTFDHNKVWSNGGPGIWFDVHSTNAVVRYNRVRDNHSAGIFFEIGNGAKIYGNSVWRNGFGFMEWGYGAGITVSSSDNVKVYKNTVAWNARAISVISQNRGPAPHNGNVVRDNVMISASGSYVAGFYDDHGGSLYGSSNGNRGYDNRYWIGGARTSGNRFQWAGGKSTLGAYNATPGEARGKYLSKAQRNKILRSKGMPTSP